MHSDPFTPTGYDIASLQREVQQKADQHELHSRDSRLDSLERSLLDLRAANDSLRHRCEILEESCRSQLEEFRRDNGQFGVGA